MKRSVFIIPIIIVAIVIAFSAYSEISYMVNTSIDITSGSGASTSPDCVSTQTCFYPNPVTISTGDTVTWTNKDSLRHRIASGTPTGEVAGTIFDSKIIEPGQTFKFTFTKAGTYDYFCIIHPWLQGQVIVK